MRNIVIAFLVYLQSTMSAHAEIALSASRVIIDIPENLVYEGTLNPSVVLRDSGKPAGNPPREADGDGVPDTDAAIEGGVSCPNDGHSPGSNIDASFINRVGYCPTSNREDTVNFCSCVARTAHDGLAGFRVIDEPGVLLTTQQLIDYNMALKIDELTEDYNQYYDELLFALGEPTMRPRALELQGSDCFPGGTPNRLAGYFNNLNNPNNPDRTCTTTQSKQIINEVFFAYNRDENDYTKSTIPTTFRPTAGANIIQHLESVSNSRYRTFPGSLENGVNLINPNVALSVPASGGQLETIAQNLLAYIEAYRLNPSSLPSPNSPEFRAIVGGLLNIPSYDLQNSSPEQLPSMVQTIFKDIVSQSGVSGSNSLTKQAVKTALQNHVGNSLRAMGERCEEMKRIMNDMCQLASTTNISETNNLFNPGTLGSNPVVARQFAQAQLRLRNLRNDGSTISSVEVDPLSMAATPEMVTDYQQFLFRVDAWTCATTTEFIGAYDARAQAIMSQLHQSNDKIAPAVIGGTSSNPTMPGGHHGHWGGQSRDNYFSNIANQEREQNESIRRSGVSVGDSQQREDSDVAELVEVARPENSGPQGNTAIPFAPVPVANKSSSVDFLPELGGATNDGAKASADQPLVAKTPGNATDPNAELRRQIEEMRATITKRQQQLEAMMQERNRQAQAGSNTSEIDALMARRREELLDLDRQLQAKRTSLSQATSAATPVADRAPAALPEASADGLAVGSPGGAAAPRPRSGSSGAASSGSLGSSGVGLNNSSASLSATGTGLASLGVVSDYSGPQLFLNGQKFDTEGKFIIDFTRLATATPAALKEIFKLSDGQPIYVRFEDNSLREYVPQAIDNGGVVFIPRDDSANRAVASKGEVEVAPVGEESSEGRVKYSDLEEILDTNVVRE